MNGKFKTNYGQVAIRSNVLARIAGLTALGCFGIVGMAAVSPGDGLVKLLTGNSIARGIKVKFDKESVMLDFHVIISYGVAVSAVADSLMNTVKYKIENMTGFKVSNINIYVEGVRVID